MVGSRLEFLQNVRDIRDLKGLEIGPLTNPIVTPQDLNDLGEIHYLDHLSTQDLKNKYADDKSVEVEKIVDVDFVCSDADIKKAVGGLNFDYVVASHVIEHSPNMLQFLSDLSSILKEGGTLFLLIPDKRFTFDIDRPETTFGTLLERYLLKDINPSVSAVYDHFAMASHANGHNLWHGISDPKDSRLLVSEAWAWDAAHSVFNEGEYLDVHTNIFTPHSFFSILKKAMLHEMFFFEVESFKDTSVGQIEFFVSLKKPSTNLENNYKKMCITSLPQLKLDNLLSPYMPQIKSLSTTLEHLSEITKNLQQEIEKVRNELASSKQNESHLRAELQLAQNTLNRRSVRLLLKLIDRIFCFVRN